MSLRFTARLRYLARRRWLWAPVAAGLVAVLFLAWRGGSGLWARVERARAERAISEFDFGEGRRRLDRCLTVRPNDPDLLLLAARTARRDGDMAAARQLLDAYRTAIGSTTPALTLERQLIAAQQGRVKPILPEMFENLDLRHPQSEQICEALAAGAVHNYQFTEALFWTKELLDRSPTNGIGRHLHARTIDTQGHRARAVTELEGVVGDFPRYFAARQSLADILFRTQRYREAIPHYATLHEQRPAEVYPLLGLASSYARLGQPEPAAPLMAELERRFPDNSEVLLECGRFALDQRDPARAEPLLRRAVDLSPFDHEILREFAICLDHLGRSVEAAEYVDRFRRIEADLVLLEKLFTEITKDQKDPDPRRRVGEICFRNGQEAEGLRWLSSVLEMNPDDGPTHRLLADYYAARGEVELAGHHRRAAGRLFQLDPPTPPPTKGGPP